MGYDPAAALEGGVAVTVTAEVEPAVTVALAAWLWLAGLALTCADLKRMDSFGYAARGYGQRAGYAQYYIQ